MNRKSFLESANGAIMERADYALNQIFDNIMDLNTKAAKKRKLTLTIELLPDDTRSMVSFSASVKPTLEPTMPIIGAYFIQEDHQGNACMVENLSQVPGQIRLDGDEQPEANVIQFKRA